MSKPLPLSPPLCCLCGLLCPTPMLWPASGDAHSCARLHDWLTTQDALGATVQRDDEPFITARVLTEQANRLSRAVSPLVWIESADVAATRAAVRLARACEGTIHIAQSPGANSVSAITAAYGFLGTTLAEVCRTADLIVHVGHQHLHEMPLLAERFLSPIALAKLSLPGAAGPDANATQARRHVFIGEQPQSFCKTTAVGKHSPDPLELLWPRESWLEQFTRVLLATRADIAVSPQLDCPADNAAQDLANILLGSRYAVIMWSENELGDELDRLLVERLLELARQVSQSTRCSLLPLSVDPGRTTAKDALLWLTNRASTTAYRAGQWDTHASSIGKSLQDWQREYDWIVCVRTLPSDRPLPDLQFDLLLDASRNQHTNVQSDFEHQSHGSTNGASSQLAGAPETIRVATVGVECWGQLTRVDHGFAALIPPLVETSTESTASNKPPATTTSISARGGRMDVQPAAVVLDALTEVYRSAKTAN